MKQSKLTSIVIALMAISHDRIDYPAGSVFEVPEKDVVFLKMAKCVREPTADELKAYEERQTLATVTATQPEETDHAGLQPQPPSDSEPDAPQAKVVKVVEANSETVQAETIGAVRIPPAETPVEEAVEPEPVEAVQPETVEADPEAVQAETIGSVKMPPAETVEVVEPETPQPEPEAVANPYDGWLKKDLNAELDKRGIDHDATATNDTLEALLIEDDAVQATAAS